MLFAAHFRIHVSDTKLCLNAADVLTLQSANDELSKLHDELAASRKEQSSLHVKVVQLTTALKSALATKVSLKMWSYPTLFRVLLSFV